MPDIDKIKIMVETIITKILVLWPFTDVMITIGMNSSSTTTQATKDWINRLMNGPSEI